MKIKFLSSAKKELSKLDKNSQILIKEKLLILAENEEKLLNNIKPLKGKYKGKFRLRVGNYRVIYEKRKAEYIILIIRIAHRKEVY